MKLQKRISLQRKRRQYRVRNRARATGCPRLSVFRSNLHIYAQVIDDVAGRTLAAASTLESELGGTGKDNGQVSAAAAVGKAVAERAIAAGVKKVGFDRGSYRYHGRVAALAEAAREAGLEF